MQAQQGVLNLASSPTLYSTAPTISTATVCTQNTHIESQDPLLTPIPSTTKPGTLTAALNHGAATREAARIYREKIVLKVAKVLDTILPDFKKNSSESAELFEKKCHSL